jgi:hypothetical protein
MYSLFLRFSLWSTVMVGFFINTFRIAQVKLVGVIICGWKMQRTAKNRVLHLYNALALNTLPLMFELYCVHPVSSSFGGLFAASAAPYYINTQGKEKSQFQVRTHTF